MPKDTFPGSVIVGSSFAASPEPDGFLGPPLDEVSSAPVLSSLLLWRLLGPRRCQLVRVGSKDIPEMAPPRDSGSAATELERSNFIESPKTSSLGVSTSGAGLPISSSFNFKRLPILSSIQFATYDLVSFPDLLDCVTVGGTNLSVFEQNPDKQY